MNQPGVPPGGGGPSIANTSASQFSPSASALYPPAVAHNARVLSSIATLSACFSGIVAGTLGLTNFWGFGLYLTSSVISAVIVAAIKCGFNVGKYVPAAHGAAGPMGAAEIKAWKGWLGLLGLGQENLLGFLLFWIGTYALIHVYD